MQQSLEEVRSALAKAKDDMAQYYNPTPEYNPRDCVFLDASDSKTTHPSQKLVSKFLGLYTVL